MKSAYLVLSVADVRAMLHAAELEQKVRGETRESVTIVLENLSVRPDDGQIASWSVNAAVEKLVSDSLEDLDAGCTAKAQSVLTSSEKTALQNTERALRPG